MFEEKLELDMIENLNDRVLKMRDLITEIIYPQPGVIYPWRNTGVSPELKWSVLSFEDILTKFHYFYALNYMNIDLPYEDYIIFKQVPEYVHSVPEASFLFPIANCVTQAMQHGYDPIGCIQNRKWLDNFIDLLRVHTLMILNLIPQSPLVSGGYLHSYSRHLSWSDIYLKLESFLNFLNKFVGEWRNNPLENEFYDEIPPEYRWYDDGEQ